MGGCAAQPLATNSAMRPQSIIQVVDSLGIGGMESVAVNFANLLAERGIQSSLCCTRHSGPLVNRLSSSVILLDLKRTGLVDLRALRRFIKFLDQQRVQVIHAHGTAIFFCSLARMFDRRRHLIWHDHFGRYLTEERPAWVYKLAVRRAAAVFAVNLPLVDWARDRLGMPWQRITYLPNFALAPSGELGNLVLPGQPGKRIVCLANLRPEKGHLVLLDAMSEIARHEPDSVLLLVGTQDNQPHVSRIKARICELNLGRHVILFGPCENVMPLLKACDIGVLASLSEGLPLALLEYGAAGLPVIATRVGQVPEVLDEGRAGLLVEPGQPHPLALALLTLLESAQARSELSRASYLRVREHYSPDKTIAQVLEKYGDVLRERQVLTQSAQ